MSSNSELSSYKQKYRTTKKIMKSLIISAQNGIQDQQKEARQKGLKNNHTYYRGKKIK